MVVLAVKPQMMADVCQPLREQVDFSGKLVLSIAAGIQVSRFYQLLGDKLNIVRIMPNTPSLVGKGMSGLYAPAQVSRQDRDYTGDLMASVGKVCWVDDENGINGVIAAAGSAPAYFFLFMEAMQRGRTHGLRQPDRARSGAAGRFRRRRLGGSQPGYAAGHAARAGDLKGGTTAEALRVFNERQLPETVAQAMQAAVSRAQEMEKLF